MTACALLDRAWSYPLFEELYGRCSRRFGLGFEMQEGPFRYKSAHAPAPLTGLEEALLVGAGAGFTGSRSGICRRRHLTLAKAAAPSRRHERAATPRCSGPTTKDSMSSTTRSRPASCARSKPGSSVGRSSPVGSTFPAACRRLSAHDLWDSNRPGSTLFLPVCDVSASLISLIAQFVDPALRKY